MNGSEMLSEINKIDSGVVNILITGHADFDLAKDAVNSGKIFKILTKPCSVEELIKTLKEVTKLSQKKVVTGESSAKDDGKISIYSLATDGENEPVGLCGLGKETCMVLGTSEKVSGAITENFGIGADSLDDSDIDAESEEDAQDDLEDQNAAIIRFVNEVVQKAIVDRATDIHFEPHKDTLQIRYRLMGSPCQCGCQTI